jgi:hypothetical protein
MRSTLRARGCSLEVQQDRDDEDLSRRESELKEKALRNKVVRTRRRTTSNPPESFGPA